MWPDKWSGEMSGENWDRNNTDLEKARETVEEIKNVGRNGVWIGKKWRQKK